MKRSSARAAASAGPAVLTGFDEFAARGFPHAAGHRLGVVSNPTAVTGDLGHIVDIMHASPDVDLVAVFGPEHGFRGTAQAGEAERPFTDPRTGLGVYNLYGASVEEVIESFTRAKVTMVAFDIQDIGARFYTYIWMMYRSMVAAAIMGVPFLVFDRPNPLGGHPARGPVLEPRFASDVGMKPIAQQHGMTVGELARLFNDQYVADDAGGSVADLSVLRARHWRRGQYFDQTGLPWVMPSPNVPTLDSALTYPGFGMFEGTNLAEGRGTTRPFELIGAPYLDHHLAETLAAAELPGAGFREVYFSPTFSKYSHPASTAAGVQVYITDRDAFDPIRSAVAVMVAANRLYPDDWSFNGYEIDGGPPFEPDWIDSLSGSTWIRDSVQARKSADEIVAGWQDELAQFNRLRARFLLYPE